MALKFPPRLLIASGVLVLGLACWWLLRPQVPGAEVSAGQDSAATADAPNLRTQRNPPSREPSVETIHDAALLQLIGKAEDEFSRSRDAESSRTILDVLRQSIREAPDEQAAAAAMAIFLNSGRDVSTQLPFDVGEDGILETAPTLRTALLDLLVTLDPTLALEMARSIMDQTQSPDEYALALRNLAWNDLNGDLQAELGARFQDLLETDDWRKFPSAGYLEAFDVAVQLNSPIQYAALLDVAAEGSATANTSLTRASMMALDRMTLRNPGLLGSRFSEDPTLSGIEPKLRASLLSRLNLADPAQREIFVSYLTTTDHGEEEMDYFTKLFPNGNYLHGHWMITTPESSPSIAQRAEEDSKVLALLDQIAAENPAVQSSLAFASIKSRLQKITTSSAAK